MHTTKMLSLVTPWVQPFHPQSYLPPPLLSHSRSHRCGLTCLSIETQATRIQTHAEGTLPPTRARFLFVRGSNERKAGQVHLLR